MRIVCERSGGFAGLTARVEVDTAALTAAQSRALQTLLERANLLEQPAPKKRKAVADGFQYDVTVIDDNAERALAFDDGSVSEEMLALLDWLMAYRPAKKVKSEK